MKSMMQGIAEDMLLKVNPYEALRESELLKKLEKSRKNAKEGMYKNAQEVSCDIREKYDL